VRSVPFVASTAALRLVRVCKEAGKPFPRFSDDDVLDYMVTEAIVVKHWDEQRKEHKRQEMREWKKRKVGSGPPGA
jgi:hypothetical protein